MPWAAYDFLFFHAEMQVMLRDLVCSSSQLCYLITLGIDSLHHLLLTHLLYSTSVPPPFVEVQNENLVAVSHLIHFPFPCWSLMDFIPCLFTEDFFSAFLLEQEDSDLETLNFQ